MFVPPGPGEQLVPELLRVGVALPDGRTATTIGSTRLYTHEAGEVQQPVLMLSGGTGDYLADGYTLYWLAQLWLWPAPPAVPFGLVVEWPAFRVAETRSTMDGAAVAETAGAAIPYWPENTNGDK